MKKKNACLNQNLFAVIHNMFGFSVEKYIRKRFKKKNHSLNHNIPNLIIFHHLIVWLHSQDAAELMQLLQSLLTPALLHDDPAALAKPVRLLRSVLSLPLLEHVDGERSAVELQHLLLENRGRWEEQQGSNDGESSFLEPPRTWPTQTPEALVLPRAQPLQTICREDERFS